MVAEQVTKLHVLEILEVLMFDGFGVWEVSPVVPGGSRKTLENHDAFNVLYICVYERAVLDFKCTTSRVRIE